MKPGQFNDKVVVIGHRGCGKNKTLSQGEIPEARPSIRENTICSFNMASKYGANFVEFDVQVTSHKCFRVSSAFRVCFENCVLVLPPYPILTCLLVAFVAFFRLLRMGTLSSSMTTTLFLGIWYY